MVYLHRQVKNGLEMLQEEHYIEIKNRLKKFKKIYLLININHSSENQVTPFLNKNARLVFN